MLPRMIRLHPSTYQRLIRLSKEAERDGAYRVSKRLQAVVLNSQGRSSGELAAILQAPRSMKRMASKVYWKDSAAEDHCS